MHVCLTIKYFITMHNCLCSTELLYKWSWLASRDLCILWVDNYWRLKCLLEFLRWTKLKYETVIGLLWKDYNKMQLIISTEIWKLGEDMSGVRVNPVNKKVHSSARETLASSISNEIGFYESDKIGNPCYLVNLKVISWSVSSMCYNEKFMSNEHVLKIERSHNTMMIFGLFFFCFGWCILIFLLPEFSKRIRWDAHFPHGFSFPEHFDFLSFYVILWGNIFGM